LPSKVLAAPCYNFLPRLDFHRAAGELQSMAKTKQKAFEYVEPIGARVLVRKDEPKRETKGGIALPDQAEIPTITGRIVAISAQIENDEDVPLRQYDKILFHPKNAIPVDFEADNQLYVVPVEDIVAVFRREVKEEEEG
jgi:chaperonin GroES